MIGKGKVGVNAGFLDQSGPNLVQDVEVDGFETGLQSQWIWGQRLSRVSLRNCRKVGMYVNANSVAAEDLTVENCPLPVKVDLPNDWHHWSGVLALDGAELRGAKPDGPAILNLGTLYARNVKTAGFKLAVDSPVKAITVAGPAVDEYCSDGTRKLFADAPDAALKLPAKPEPQVPYDPDPQQWVCANDFGAKAGDNQDDTDAIRKAIDSAAAAGKSTVYFRGCGGGDPNWYSLSAPVKVHGSVRMVLGLGWARLLGDEQKGAGFVLEDAPGAAATVKFQNIDSFGGTPILLTNRSGRTLVVESCGVTIVGDGTGEIFATDCPAHVRLKRAGQRMQARQLNPEGDSDNGLVQNAGGELRILGMKNEGRGVRIGTTAGGRTEVLGVFNYGPGLKADDKRPMFLVEDAALSVCGLRELAFGGDCWHVKVTERRGGETKSVGSDKEGGWIGWAHFSARPPAKP